MAVKLVQVNRQKCSKGEGWDICDSEGNKIAWADELVLLDADFHVSQIARGKILENGQRIRHAWIAGVWDDELKPDGRINDKNEVTYNPFKHTTFTRLPDLSPVFDAQKVYFYKFGAFIDLQE